MSWAPNSREFREYAVSITINKNGFLDGAFMRIVLYSAVIAIFFMMIALIVKLLWNCEGEEQAAATDNSCCAGVPTADMIYVRLLPSDEEAVFSNYGTTSDEDIEPGKLSCSSSSEDLYNEKICAICYDDQRSCLFIPCGHCITCFTCAKRIINEEKTKTCPICRTVIHKVRKLQIL